MDIPEILESPRLVLRKPSLDDADAIFKAYGADPEVTRYLLWRPNTDVKNVADFLQKALQEWENVSTTTWVIALKTTGELIGSIDLRIETHANLGYVLARRQWNKGYMTEAVKTVVSWALRQEEILRVWAVCDVENIGSARVLQKAGLECEGILHAWIVLPNRSTEPRDCYRYSILK